MTSSLYALLNFKHPCWPMLLQTLVFCITDVPPKPWHFCRYAAIGQKLKRVYASSDSGGSKYKDSTKKLAKTWPSTSFNIFQTIWNRAETHQLPVAAVACSRIQSRNPKFEEGGERLKDMHFIKLELRLARGHCWANIDDFWSTCAPPSHPREKARFWCIGCLAPDSPSRCSVHNMHRPEYVAGVVVVSWLQQWQHDQCISMSCLPLHVHTSTDTLCGLVDAW